MTIVITDAGCGRSEKYRYQRGGEPASEESHVKALIAEDEPLFRKILQELLSPEFDLTSWKTAQQPWPYYSKRTAPH
jgi:hypothetical protein